MTRDEILKMQAGREMDALVHANIFGAVSVKMKNVFPGFDGFVFADQDGKFCPVPKYSTDIGAAWQIVEHFHNEATLNNVHGVWEVHLQGICGKSQSAPLAICRSALLASI